MYAVVTCSASMRVTCHLITKCDEEANHKVDRIVKSFIDSCKKGKHDYKQVDDSFECKERDDNVIREVHLYMNGCFYEHIQIFEE